MAPDGLAADEWLACVRRSACYADLGRRSFEGVLDMLAGRYGSGEVAEFAPRILWDRETGLLAPRPGSQRLAVTAAGTIPDRGMFSVVLPEGDARQGRRRVGELDEEMVMESRVGDIIALGRAPGASRRSAPTELLWKRRRDALRDCPSGTARPLGAPTRRAAPGGLLFGRSTAVLRALPSGMRPWSSMWKRAPWLRRCAIA